MSSTITTKPGETVRSRPEMLLFLFLLAIFNLHFVSDMSPLHFHPESVRQGEWWRVFTHPFVHVAPYHLVLDGLAFLLLYGTLQTASTARRLTYAAASAAGSLGLALLVSPAIENIGLCGLSGTAHGLMAIAGLEMVRLQGSDKTARRIGWLTLLVVTAKALYETVSGDVLFSSLHVGSVGTPIAACHLGGVLGGAAVFCVLTAAAKQDKGAVRIPGPGWRFTRSVARSGQFGSARSGISRM